MIKANKKIDPRVMLQKEAGILQRKLSNSESRCDGNRRRYVKS